MKTPKLAARRYRLPFIRVARSLLYTVARLVATATVLAAIVGFVRDAVGLNEFLLIVRDWLVQALTPPKDVAQTSTIVAIAGSLLDSAVVVVTTGILATVCTRLPSFIGALVLAYVGLAQGRRLTSTVELVIVLSLPSSLAFAIALSGVGSLAALGAAAFSVIYIRVAIDPRRIRYSADRFAHVQTSLFGLPLGAIPVENADVTQGVISDVYDGEV